MCISSCTANNAAQNNEFWSQFVAWQVTWKKSLSKLSPEECLYSLVVWLMTETRILCSHANVAVIHHNLSAENATSPWVCAGVVARWFPAVHYGHLEMYWSLSLESKRSCEVVWDAVVILDYNRRAETSEKHTCTSFFSFRTNKLWWITFVDDNYVGRYHEWRSFYERTPKQVVASLQR